MAAISFAARRRETRSSSRFHLGLASCLLLCMLLSWCSSHFLSPLPNPHLSSSDNPASRRSTSFNHDYDINSNSQNQDTIIMGSQHSQSHSHNDPQTPRQELVQSHRKSNINNQVISPDSSLTMAMTTQRATIPVRLVTLNIRYATSKNDRSPGEEGWDVRCPKVCTQLRFISAGHDSPFICLQEVLHSQLTDIQSLLGRPWAHIGRGRGDHENDGEFSPIFYRADTWTCDHSETRWLSKTPDRPSRGWDAVLNRIVTIGVFTNRATGARVVVMSTHFDHIGVQARKNSASLLIRFAKEWSRLDKGKPSAVLIGGDFNSPVDDEAYRMMTAPGSGMSDIADLVPKSEHYGNDITYTSFGEPDETPQRIDFLFVREPRTARIETFGVLPNRFDDRIRISDHRPVVSDLSIEI